MGVGGAQGPEQISPAISLVAQADKLDEAITSLDCAGATVSVP